ncbi:DNA-directed RNA polymerase III subunit RPC5-like isoform X2 [Pocillopora verrucosa]|uniref:DNA-directed RNA polymerase III subunit RPC5-like isoform X2 n=3 Tax=Pocillopora verrucosa TaxID=203993 RepID=UPI00333F3552
MADDEDDDPVVAEVDVYLAQTLANNLYLFQYPVRPADITYDDIPHIGARIKPDQQKVELELSINTSSDNYYAPRGEQIAHDVDGSALSSASEGKESFFSSDKMDKQVLSSSRASEDVSRYSVGILKGGELHLTPVHGVLQLRPSFEYLNKGEANVNQASNPTDEGDSQDEEEEAKPLTVKFARPETERAKAQRLSSFKYLEQKKAEEPWKTMEFYNPQNDIAGVEHSLLFCREMESESPEFNLHPRDYLKLLTPSTSQEESSKPPVPSNVLSMTQLKTMDLADQVRALLIKAKVISFSQLCRLLSPAAKEASVLKCLQQYAVLVQGCWVVKSELLYPEGTISPSGGIAADILCKGRDYLMWRFTQSRVVVRKDIKSVTKLPSEDIKEMLDQMSRMKVTIGWEFVLPYDIEFVQKHPDVYKQQLTMWEAKYQVLQKQLNVPKQDKLGVDLKRMNTDSCPSIGNKRVSKPSKSKSNHVMNHNTSQDGSTEEEHLPMEIDCKEVASNNMNHELRKEPLATNDTHVQDLLKILQDFVREKLHRTVLSLADFKRLLLLRRTASSPGDPLCSGVPDVLLEKAILGTGATEIDFKWPTEALSGDIQSRRLFSFRSTGDSADEYRALLLDMFSKSWVLTRKEFNARATEQVGAVPGRKEWMTIQQDLLERMSNRHSQWYLRGTSTILTNL